MTWATAVAFFWKYKQWFIYAGIALAVWGGLAYWGHTKYEQGQSSGKAIAAAAKEALAVEVAARKQDRLQYESSVAAIKSANDTEITRIKDANKKSQDGLKREIARLTAEKAEQNAKVDVQIPVGSSKFVFPSNFRVLYNQRIESFPGFDGQKTADSIGTLGKTETVDANLMTKKLLGCVDEYNEVSSRYIKLIENLDEREHAQ